MLFTNQDRECVVTPPPMRFAQGKLREGSGSMGQEMLRCAQHDSTDFGRETSLSAGGHGVLIRASLR
jgi:hypothetical protein